MLFFGQSGNLYSFDCVDLAQDVSVRGISDGAQEGGDGEFPAAAAAVKEDLDHIVDVKLDIDP